MPEIEMPPQYAGTYSDPQDTEGHVRRAIEAKAADRVNLWTSFVLSAISDFESAAKLHIEQLEYDHDAKYSFNPILGSFVSATLSAFPPTAMATSAISTVMGGIQSSYEQNLKGGLSGAKLRLHRSVFALAKVARERTRLAASKIHEGLPEAVEDAMTWVDSASTDSDYVSAFCDWMGFPVPTDENTTNRVRQALENPFFGVYQAVRAQLLRIEGVPGLDDDDLSPVTWEREAVEHQRELYRQDGPEAWEKAYEEIH
jgi:hypothetical protein